MNFAEFFGVDASDVFEQKQRAEGYLAGCDIARRMHEATFNEMKDKPRVYLEACLQAIREQL